MISKVQGLRKKRYFAKMANITKLCAWYFSATIDYSPVNSCSLQIRANFVSVSRFTPFARGFR